MDDDAYTPDPCPRCHGSGIDPDGFDGGMYGSDDCRRCGGEGTK